MPVPPTGTVTFLFTDIEGSTRLVRHLGAERYGVILELHHKLLRSLFRRWNGHEVSTEGDAFFVTFGSARDALSAAVEAQRSVSEHAWPKGSEVRVRMGLHTGEGRLAAGNYVGLDVHRAARIASTGHGGQILVSETTHSLTKNEPPEGVGFLDLGIHQLKDLAEPERIYQVLHQALHAEFPGLKSLTASTNNLPLQLTTFIGRGHERAEIKRLLSKTRLVTIKGAPGSGKTRLALQVASELLEAYPDGVFFVDLAVVADGSLVVDAVRAEVGIGRFETVPGMEILVNHLRAKSMLLLLDNCEHVIEATSELAPTLLSSCPAVGILATSRENLRVDGEAIFDLAPLPIPDVRQRASVEKLMQSESVQLFVDRAKLVHPHLELTDRNAQAIAWICARLDGIPLALELAAARVSGFSAEEIADRLARRFEILTHGKRTALPRHRTMWAAIEWSYDLLDTKEAAVFCRMSVFPGNCTLSAAESVCQGSGVEREEVADLVARLVEKSLVDRHTRGWGAGYRMLGTLHEFAGQKLADSEEGPSVARRHAEYFLRLAEESLPELVRERQAYWLIRLEEDHSNFLAALDWCAEHHEGEWGLKIATALAWFWMAHGHFAEGQRRLEHFLALPANQARVGLRGWGLIGLAMMLHHQGKLPDAAKALEEALSIFEEREDDHGAVAASSNLGNVMVSQGHHSRALERYRASLPIFERLGHQRGVAATLNNMGNATRLMGDPESAETLMKQGLSISREIGDIGSVAKTLDNLGRLALERGDLDSAQSLIQESLEHTRQLGDRYAMAGGTYGLAQVAIVRRDFGEARRLLADASALYQELGAAHGEAIAIASSAEIALREGKIGEAAEKYAESVERFQRLGDKWSGATAKIGLGNALLSDGKPASALAWFRQALEMSVQMADVEVMAKALAGLARVASASARYRQAAVLLGASEAMRESQGPMPEYVRAEYEAAKAHLRSYGDGDLSPAWEEGRRMSSRDAADWALAAHYGF